MKNSNGNSKFKTVLSGIAIFTASVLTLGLALGLCYSAGLFGSDKVIENSNGDDFEASSVVLSDDTSSGISLLSATISEDDYDSYGITESNVESAFLLTATVNSNATNPLLVWTLSGGDDVSNVTLVPSDDTLSCAVVCTAAFETQIVITCAANGSTTVKSTCTLDYVRRISSVGFYGEGYDYETLFYVNSNNSAKNADLNFSDSVYSAIDGFEYYVGWFYFEPTFSTGTVYEDLVDFCFGCIETITGTTYKTNAYISDNVSITDSNTVYLVDDVYSHDGQYFTMEIYPYIGKVAEYLWGIDIYDLSDSEYTTLYNNLLDYYNNGTSIVSLAFSATGAITGTSYYFEMPCLINPEGLEVAVSSIQLSDSSLYA